MAQGAVCHLHRWPVKSLAGEAVTALRLDHRGIAGDRAHALFEAHDRSPTRPARRLTIRQVPGMLRWSASYPDAPDDALEPDAVPLPRVVAPDGSAFAWDDPALDAALTHDLGRPVRRHRDAALMQDLGNSILVTTEASLRAISLAVGRPLERQRFRPNLHLALDAPAFAEEDWEGRRLRVGDVELELLHPSVRCVIPTRDPRTTAKDARILRWLARERRTLFGINARAYGPGRVALGDPVELR